MSAINCQPIDQAQEFHQPIIQIHHAVVYDAGIKNSLKIKLFKNNR